MTTPDPDAGDDTRAHSSACGSGDTLGSLSKKCVKQKDGMLEWGHSQNWITAAEDGVLSYIVALSTSLKARFPLSRAQCGHDKGTVWSGQGQSVVRTRQSVVATRAEGPKTRAFCRGPHRCRCMGVNDDGMSVPAGVGDVWEDIFPSMGVRHLSCLRFFSILRFKSVLK